MPRLFAPRAQAYGWGLAAVLAIAALISTLIAVPSRMNGFGIVRSSELLVVLPQEALQALQPDTPILFNTEHGTVRLPIVRHESSPVSRADLKSRFSISPSLVSRSFEPSSVVYAKLSGVSVPQRPEKEYYDVSIELPRRSLASLVLSGRTVKARSTP